MSQIAARSPVPSIDTDAIRIFTDVLFGNLDGLVPVRLLAEQGTPHKSAISRYPKSSDITTLLVTEAAGAAASRRGVFVVPGTVAIPGRAKAEDISQTGVVLIDLDTGDIAAKRDHLVRHLGEPTLLVASGGTTDERQPKLHLYWRLTEAASGEALALVCRLRAAIADKVGGDRSFASAHQPIRVAGTIHGKNDHQVSVRILWHSKLDYDLTELAEAVGRMPFLPGMAVRIDTGTKRRRGPTATDLMTRSTRAGAVDEVTRFEALSMVIGHWVRNMRVGRSTREGAWEAVRACNAAMIVPPWEAPRLRREFDKILARDVWSQGPMPSRSTGTDDTDTAVLPPPLSEDALAAAFVDQHGAHWRHVALWSAWFRWTGRHWAQDETGTLRELVRQVCRAAAASQEPSANSRRIAAERTIRSVATIASTDPKLSVHTSDWDTHPMLLNTPAGVVDLDTGEVRPHDPTLLLTQLAGASPGHACPRWRAFLEEVTGGDRELQAYLARLSGYCLTGSMREQVFVFLHGSGANGKSVFLQTLAHVLGDYAATAPFETFMASTFERHSTDLAGLRAARFVVVPETETGRAWAEARIKAITGGDPIRARFMHRDFFEFRPQFKLAVAGNHRPTLSNVGEAMRRRLHLVPFTVTIPPAKRDQRLAEKLLDEKDGILGWMIEGCAAWQSIGLAPSPSVLAAAEDYFAEEDVVGHWIAEACSTGPQHRSSARALFASWSRWTQDAGHAAGSQKSLGEALRQRGFMATKISGARGWDGIAPQVRREMQGDDQ